MPVTKIYDIVTNDKYELPVKYHLVGAKNVANYIGISEVTVRKYLCYGWHGKYKAIEVGVKKKRKVDHRQQLLKWSEKNRRNYARRKAVISGNTRR